MLHFCPKYDHYKGDIKYIYMMYRYSNNIHTMHPIFFLYVIKRQTLSVIMLLTDEPNLYRIVNW